MALSSPLGATPDEFQLLLGRDLRGKPRLGRSAMYEWLRRLEREGEVQRFGRRLLIPWPVLERRFGLTRDELERDLQTLAGAGRTEKDATPR